MRLIPNTLQEDKIPVDELQALGDEIEAESGVGFGDVFIEMGRGDRFDYQETQEKLNILDAMLGTSSQPDLPENLEKVLEQDTEETEPDNVVSISSTLPNDYVFAHEVGHINYDEQIDREFDTLINATLSEMVAEATAYHFTDHDPENPVLDRDPVESAGPEIQNYDNPEELYQEMTNNQYSGPIDIPHSVGCRLGYQLIKEGGTPQEIIENISEYRERAEKAAKMTIEYLNERDDPKIKELDQAYEEVLG